MPVPSSLHASGRMAFLSAFAIVLALCEGLVFSAEWEDFAPEHSVKMVSARAEDKTWFVDTGNVLWYMAVDPETGGAHTATKAKEGVKWVSAAYDGSVWIIDTNDDLSRRDLETDLATSPWERFPSKQKWKQISARSYFEFVGIDSEKDAWHYLADEWVQLTHDKKADYVSIGFDDSIWLVESGTLWYRDWAKMNWEDTKTHAALIDAYTTDKVELLDYTKGVMWGRKPESAIKEMKWTKHDRACESMARTDHRWFCVDKQHKLFGYRSDAENGGPSA